MSILEINQKLVYLVFIVCSSLEFPITWLICLFTLSQWGHQVFEFTSIVIASLLTSLEYNPLLNGSNYYNEKILKLSFKRGFKKIQTTAYSDMCLIFNQYRQKEQIKPFNKTATLLKDWTKIVMIKSARCATKSKSKQKVVDYGFFDKTLCSHALETVTYWSQEIIFKLLNFGQETYPGKLPIQLSKGFGPDVEYQCHGYHFLCR